MGNGLIGVSKIHMIRKVVTQVSKKLQLFNDSTKELYKAKPGTVDRLSDVAGIEDNTGDVGVIVQFGGEGKSIISHLETENAELRKLNMKLSNELDNVIKKFAATSNNEQVNVDLTNKVAEQHLRIEKLEQEKVDLNKMLSETRGKMFEQETNYYKYRNAFRCLVDEITNKTV